MTETRTDQLRTLVVEDEFLIRLALVDMLASLGITTISATGSLDEAIEWSRTREFDLAVLDVNLGGKTVYPAAEILRARKVPLFFTTGYGIEGILEQWRTTPIVHKPYEAVTLRRAIDTVVAERKGKGASPTT